MTKNAYLREFSSYCEGKLGIMQLREDGSLNWAMETEEHTGIKD